MLGHIPACFQHFPSRTYLSSSPVMCIKFSTRTVLCATNCSVIPFHHDSLPKYTAGCNGFNNLMIQACWKIYFRVIWGTLQYSRHKTAQQKRIGVWILYFLNRLKFLNPNCYECNFFVAYILGLAQLNQLEGLLWFLFNTFCRFLNHL